MLRSYCPWMVRQWRLLPYRRQRLVPKPATTFPKREQCCQLSDRLNPDKVIDFYTLTTAADDSGSGIGSPSSFNPSRWKTMASEIC